jgi:hypothetical protein
LTGVKGDLELSRRQSELGNQWPPATLPYAEGLWTRPVAVEIVIEFKDWGRVRRLVEIAG